MLKNTHKFNLHDCYDVIKKKNHSSSALSSARCKDPTGVAKWVRRVQVHPVRIVNPAF